ncbi:MAG: glycosyltransferase family 39 protein, partial [Anaerolineae bacterium]|nr:glycosyltransferase family 39 protein [Anaerolineae bacterium]
MAERPDRSPQPTTMSADPTRWCSIGYALVLSGTIIWLFGVLAAYYVVHKPFDLVQLRALGQVVLDVALWCGVLVIAVGGGLRVIGAMQLPSLSPVEQMLFGWGIGGALWGYAVMGLGWAGLLHPAGIALLGAFLLGWQLVRPQPLRFAWQTLRVAWPRPCGRFEWLLAGVAVFCLLVGLIRALAPPYAFDALVYHLRQARLYLAAHSLFVPVDSAYAGFPGLLQMLFASTQALGGDSASQLLHFTFLPATILGAAALGRRLWQLDLTWPIAALLTTVPTLFLVATWPYVDVALMFYTLLFFYALVFWLQDTRQQWLTLAAVLCGVAMEIKYTALWYPLAAAGLVILRLRRDGWRITLLRWVYLGSIAALVAAPWYLRNWVLTGNPIYPYLWGGPAWDAGRTTWWDRVGTGLMTQPWRLLIAPWEMTIFGIEGRAGYQATLGPLLLALAPVILATWRHLHREEKRGLGWITLFSGVLYAVWLWGVARSALLMQSRLLLPIFPLVGLVAALALQRLPALDTRTFSVSWVFRAATALVLVLHLFTTVSSLVQDRPLAALLGGEPRSAYVSRRVGSAYTAAMERINTLPESANILFLWEPRTYHCQRVCLPDSLYDNLVYLVRQHGEAPRLSQALSAQGITHLLLNRAIFEVAVQEGSDPIPSQALKVLKELQAHHLESIYDDGVAY